MAGPDDVMLELQNNNDIVVIYDGAYGFPEAGRRTGSLRYAAFKLIWDLLRFQKLSAFSQPFKADQAFGLRDQVSRILFLQEQNNLILRAIAKTTGADISQV